MSGDLGLARPQYTGDLRETPSMSMGAWTCWLPRYFQSKESVSPFAQTLIHRSGPSPVKGASSGRCRQGRSAASTPVLPDIYR
jgi:hypothetical protein